jgi:hypothetical protein
MVGDRRSWRPPLVWYEGAQPTGASERQARRWELMSKLPDLSTPLAGWFDRLVKNKMGSVAVSVAGIAVSCFLLTFSKLFDEFVYIVIGSTGSVMLIVSASLFVIASARQVFVGFNILPSRNRDHL